MPEKSSAKNDGEQCDHRVINPDPVIEAYKSGIDNSLIRRNLALSIDERFEQLMSLQRLADELRAAGKRSTKR
jgi:hypothetical protein